MINGIERDEKKLYGISFNGNKWEVVGNNNYIVTREKLIETIKGAKNKSFWDYFLKMLDTQNS